MQYAIAHRARVTNEIEIVRADGSVVYVQNDVEPLFDTRGHVYGCVSVCVDLTDRKLAEIALRDADRRKDEFLATLSHELRNPLAPIRTAVEIMRLAPTDRRSSRRRARPSSGSCCTWCGSPTTCSTSPASRTTGSSCGASGSTCAPWSRAPSRPAGR